MVILKSDCFCYFIKIVKRHENLGGGDSQEYFPSPLEDVWGGTPLEEQWRRKRKL